MHASSPDFALTELERWQKIEAALQANPPDGSLRFTPVREVDGDIEIADLGSEDMWSAYDRMGLWSIITDIPSEQEMMRHIGRAFDAAMISIDVDFGRAAVAEGRCLQHLVSSTEKAMSLRDTKCQHIERLRSLMEDQLSGHAAIERHRIFDMDHPSD